MYSVISKVQFKSFVGHFMQVASNELSVLFGIKKVAVLMV